MLYAVTKTYEWTVLVEAPDESTAESEADEREIPGADLINDGYQSTSVEEVPSAASGSTIDGARPRWRLRR